MTPVRWIVAALALLAALGYVPLVIGSAFLRVPVPIPPYLWKETIENRDAVGALRSAAGPLLGGSLAFWLAGWLLALALARRARVRLRSM